jgi:hypothetical protein
MAATRLSRLQTRIRRWGAAEYPRTNGGRANSPQALGLLLPHAQGNIRRRRRALEKPGWSAMGRAPGRKAEHVILTPAGRHRVAQVM